MSQYLSLECDPVEQPAATDPLERATWCALRIRIAHRAVTRLWDKSRLGASGRPMPSNAPTPNWSPADYGYALARWVRECAGRDPLAPLGSVEEVARRVVDAPVEVVHCNHVPGRGIRAIVGGSAREARLTIVGPPHRRPDSQRFVVARGAYHALFGCARGERLVTDAHTWDQKVSRAFAAELLAPRQALVEKSGDTADRDKVDELAQTFEVSPMVIEKQLANAGVALADE